MNKHQLIEDIRKHNITAQPSFLARFDEEALRQYLEHLEEAHNKRLRHGTTSSSSEHDNSDVRKAG